MTEAAWQASVLAGMEDQQVIAAVSRCFGAIYRQQFSGEWLVNHDLPVEVRAFRRSDGWCVFLLLTPWMMARVFLPERDPGLSIPDGWSAAGRAAEPFVVIGPLLDFPILGGRQNAHLNYLPELGHFLLQPLVQSMERYDSADAVFSDWGEVIKTRDRVMQEQQRDCGWQKEVSRREFFSRLMGTR
ncbi:MAG: [NiFe]-hydrogenase assembly chaperone HybE [Sulfuricella denitrificans]|nr:[NiFe]-hydrogenase assembly chaperone HybE [Sulfuricella denitrificans]